MSPAPLVVVGKIAPGTLVTRGGRYVTHRVDVGGERTVCRESLDGLVAGSTGRMCRRCDRVAVDHHEVNVDREAAGRVLQDAHERDHEEATMSGTGYAADTSVPVEKTRMEIDALLNKHGAKSRGIVVDDTQGTAMIGFVLNGLQYRLVIPLPTPDVVKKIQRPRLWSSWDAERRERWFVREWEQRCRSRWRQMLLLLKAKFQAIEMQVSNVEKEFMADLVLPNGETVTTALGRSIAEALGTGKMPTLMLPERS